MIQWRMHPFRFTQLQRRWLRHLVDTARCSLRMTVLCLSGLVSMGLFGADSTTGRAPPKID